MRKLSPRLATVYNEWSQGLNPGSLASEAECLSSADGLQPPSTSRGPSLSLWVREEGSTKAPSRAQNPRSGARWRPHPGSAIPVWALFTWDQTAAKKQQCLRGVGRGETHSIPGEPPGKKESALPWDPCPQEGALVPSLRTSRGSRCSSSHWKLYQQAPLPHEARAVPPTKLHMGPGPVEGLRWPPDGEANAPEYHGPQSSSTLKGPSSLLSILQKGTEAQRKQGLVQGQTAIFLSDSRKQHQVSCVREISIWSSMQLHFRNRTSPKPRRKDQRQPSSQVGGVIPVEPCPGSSPIITDDHAPCSLSISSGLGPSSAHGLAGYTALWLQFCASPQKYVGWPFKNGFNDQWLHTAIWTNLFLFKVLFIICGCTRSLLLCTGVL